MAVKPIIFNTEMARAILENRKTETRRLIRFPPGLTGSHSVGRAGDTNNPLGLFWACGIKRPPYQIGDILWVRETWQPFKGKYEYRADIGNSDLPWRPSIHMPKEAARIFLRVKDITVERLQKITPEQCINEGVERTALNAAGEEFARGVFSDIWDRTVEPADRARYGWEANPWVWVIKFERVDRPENWPNTEGSP